MISAVSYPRYNVSKVNFKGNDELGEETVAQKVDKFRKGIPDVSRAIDTVGNELNETADSIKGAAGGAVAAVGSVNILANAFKEPAENVKSAYAKAKDKFTIVKENGTRTANWKSIGVAGGIVAAIGAVILTLKGIKSHKKKVAVANAIKKEEEKAKLAEAEAKKAEAQKIAEQAKTEAAQAKKEAVQAEAEVKEAQAIDEVQNIDTLQDVAAADVIEDTEAENEE